MYSIFIWPKVKTTLNKPLEDLTDTRFKTFLQARICVVSLLKKHFGLLLLVEENFVATRQETVYKTHFSQIYVYKFWDLPRASKGIWKDNYSRDKTWPEIPGDYIKHEKAIAWIWQEITEKIKLTEKMENVCFK